MLHLQEALGVETQRDIAVATLYSSPFGFVALPLPLDSPSAVAGLGLCCVAARGKVAKKCRTERAASQRSRQTAGETMGRYWPVLGDRPRLRAADDPGRA